MQDLLHKRRNPVDGIDAKRYSFFMGRTVRQCCALPSDQRRGPPACRRKAAHTRSARREAAPLAGTILLVASPIRFSDTPVQYRTTPPQLGQHTRKVLDDVLGLSTGAIDELSNQGVLG